MVYEHEEEMARWQASRLERVAGPEGWLTVVGLAWLEEGSNAVGSGPDSAVALPARAPKRFGLIDVDGDGATLRADHPFEHEGRTVTELRLRDDVDGRPTVVRLGPVSFFVIRRDDRLAVRVRDAEARARTAFRGLDYFPADRRWRLAARFDPYDAPRTIHLPTVLDTVETYTVPGVLVFEVDGRVRRLEAYLERGESNLFVMFGDSTNGDETFDGGRYLYANPPGVDGVVIVDFNKSYNPPCVFTPHATCALPPPENRLPFAVEAGEKRYAKTY